MKLTIILSIILTATALGKCITYKKADLVNDNGNCFNYTQTDCNTSKIGNGIITTLLGCTPSIVEVQCGKVTICDWSEE